MKYKMSLTILTILIILSLLYFYIYEKFDNPLTINALILNEYKNDNLQGSTTPTVPLVNNCDKNGVCLLNINFTSPTPPN